MSSPMNGASSSAASPVQPRAASGFFVDSKKGEVNELKALLKNINVERDMKRKRDVLKKVIAYMTLGIDVSRLFTEMIMAIETKDVVVKKMVYLYLSTQAHKEPEMAIMCINSLRRECENEDPMVRGLALRSLCNLRMVSILEYVQDPIHKGMVDLSAYVRRVAVMGVLKVHHLSPDTVDSSGWRGQLHEMLQDPDAAVVSNVMFTLNEMMLAQGGMLVSAAVVMPLLNRIAEFNEWGLQAVLDYVARYKPSSEEETFAIMNLLDPVLRSANSGAVLGTIKCFMTLTQGFPELRPQVWMRAKPPLLTFITGSAPETQFAVLKHLQLVLPDPAAKGVFDDEYRQLFVRYNEPPHVKHLKVALLPLVINETNCMEVSAELSEYVCDVDAELARCAIVALGDIALRIRSAAGELTERLLALLDMDVSYVRSAAIVQLVALARAYSDVAHSLVPHLPHCLRAASDDDEARSCVVWLLGESARQSPEAPYLLEKLIDDFAQEPSVAVKLQLLTSTAKAYFSRPPEVQKMLGRLLKAALNDVTDQDTHDRALLYYRLLAAGNLDVAKDVLAAPDAAQDIEFTEMREGGTRRAELLEEFNTLAVVFDMPSSHFVAERCRLRLDMAPISDDTFEPPAAPDGYVPSGTSWAGGSVGMGDLLGEWDNSSGSASAPAAPAALSLRAGASIPAPDFQQRWPGLQAAFDGELCAAGAGAPAQIAAAAQAAGIFVVASGGSVGACKLFLYAEQVDDSLLGDGAMQECSFLAQLAVAGGKANAQVKVSSGNAAHSDAFAQLLRSLI